MICSVLPLLELATLARGTGMLKTAKLHGVGCGTVQRISRELAMRCR
jgi:hypothetical protein